MCFLSYDKCADSVAEVVWSRDILPDLEDDEEVGGLGHNPRSAEWTSQYVKSITYGREIRPLVFRTFVHISTPHASSPHRTYRLFLRLRLLRPFPPSLALEDRVVGEDG